MNEEAKHLLPVDNEGVNAEILELDEKESAYLLETIGNICNIYFSAQELPDEVNIDRQSTVYLSKILDILREFNLIM